MNRWALARLGAAIFLSMNVMVFTMALWARDLDPGHGTPLDVTLAGLFRYLALLFTLPVVWLLGGPLAINTIDALRSGRPSTDVLLLSGVAAALALSAVAVVRDEGPVYFEVACGVLVLVTLGRWVEATGKQRAGEALRGLERLLPDTVRRMVAGRETQVPTADVCPGDILRVLPGERVACDAVLLQHAATFDEQLLTGESQPVVKDIGDPVRAGSLVVDGDVWLEATAAVAESTAVRFLALVRQSLEARGGYERLADRVTRLFLPIVAIVAIAASVGHALTSGVSAGVFAGLAVVLIACPCALGVATPLAVWAAVGRAARLGVLFRTPVALERLGSVQAARFDKTGTLTTGRAKVASVHVVPGESSDSLWSEAAALAIASTHPYSIAIGEAAADRGIEPIPIVGPVRTTPGRGLEGVASAPIALGSVEFLTALGCTWPEPLAKQCRREIDSGASICAFCRAGVVRGLFVLREELRPEARTALSQIRDLGLDVAILTGDHSARAATIAAELGMPAEGGLMPEDKIAAVRRAQVQIGPVAVVGDGLNDAGALAAADAGIAMGCGADVTREVADVCLLGNDLRRAADAIALARQTRRTIRQNLFWALAYNVGGIGLACTGRLNPVWAALAMVVSSFSVLGNSLRLSAAPAMQETTPTESQSIPAGVGP
ncbi:MAG: cation-translocating P-type ATPase [Gemmataceae bacterium]